MTQRTTTTTLALDGKTIDLTIYEPNALTRMQLGGAIPSGDPDQYTLEETSKFATEMIDACTDLSRPLIGKLRANTKLRLCEDVCNAVDRWGRLDDAEHVEFMDDHDGAPSVGEIYDFVTDTEDE